MKVLFIDLLLLGDIINAAHVAASLLSYKESVEIDVLTYRSNLSVAEVCDTFRNIYCIDREKVHANMLSSKQSLIEKYHSVNKEISSLLENEYDLVVNLTHNKISSIVGSLIRGKKYVGVYLEDNKTITVKSDNHWMDYFNDFVAQNHFNSYQYIDVYKKALQILLI